MQTLLAKGYSGEVVNVSGDHIDAVFEIGNDLIEQSFDRIDFIQVPEKGDLLMASIHIVKIVKEPEPKEQKPRKNVIPLPRVF